jgi:CDP-glycerol glycerophosphotransferase
MRQSMAWHAGRVVSWTLPRVMPAGAGILFGSDQPDDPDALVILDHLAAHSHRALRWTAPVRPSVGLLGAAARARVVAASERSLSSLIAYGRAPVVFHTAGLYTSPQPPPRRTVVTVWHGDGPKASHPPQVRGSVMVAGVERFGRRRIAVHGYADGDLLVTGRPRVDDLFRAAEEPISVADRRAVGLDERPTVWWMPTWRQDSSGRAEAMDTAAIDVVNAPGIGDFQFVVKPHRLAPPQSWPAGWQVVTDSDLRRQGVRLYRLLGDAHAILTDYSSVWSDFLGTRIPLAFILGDLDAYTTARGFYDSDWRDRLPGPILRDRPGLVAFLEEGWTAEHRARRQEVVQELGANNGPGATARLLGALDARGVSWT